MLTREELEMMNVENLRKYASKVGVKKSRSYRKAELIEEIIKVQHENEIHEIEVFGTDEEIAELEKSKVEPEKEVGCECEAAEDKEKEQYTNAAHLKYIENADVGTIVAFKIGSKVKSAKIINRSTKNQLLKLETAYGKIFVIPYKDILWVKTTNRWPKGIYELFEKKVVNTDGEEG